jgi:hypothetical protein
MARGAAADAFKREASRGNQTRARRQRRAFLISPDSGYVHAEHLAEVTPYKVTTLSIRSLSSDKGLP